MMDEQMMLGKVMIVEDEVIVSTDLKIKIQKMGYSVTDCVRYGEEVLERARKSEPDIVLMDINLKGEMDGTEAAEQVANELDLPVIFLTAFTDDTTLKKAKLSGPFSYLTKPIRFEDLRINIEVALYKAEIAKQLKQEELRFRTVADFTYDWETWIDPKGELIYISPSCQRITGYTMEDFLSNPDLLDSIIDPNTKKESDHGNQCHRHEQKDFIKTEFSIIRTDGEKRWLEHICQPVFSPNGDYLGRRASNRDITERKSVEEAKEKLILELKEAMDNIKTLGDLLPICCSCKKIRDDEGYWNQVEEYLRKRTGTEFSHSLCPDCAIKLYPDVFKKKV